MVHKKEEGTYHCNEKCLDSSARKALPLLLIPEYSGINKGQRVPDRSKTAHSKPLVKCFLTLTYFLSTTLSKKCNNNARLRVWITKLCYQKQMI